MATPDASTPAKDPATLDYLRSQNVAELYDDALNALVKEKPADARAWLSAFFANGGCDDYPPKGLARALKGQPDYVQAGCGDLAYDFKPDKATFGVDGSCPDDVPDLTNHKNCLAVVLGKHKEIWKQLKDEVTPNGVTFAQCIKTGIDCPDHPYVDDPVGITAGDEDSYTKFKQLFDPVIELRHGWKPGDKHSTDRTNIAELSRKNIDPEGRYVLTSRVRTGRSVRGFRLPPVIDFEERRELESIVVKALLKLDNDLAGDYYPLNGSRSYAPRPNGMSEEMQDELRQVGELFSIPSSKLLLSSGMGRHWPDARGIFCNKGKNFFVWVNEEDHLRIISMQGSQSKTSPADRQTDRDARRDIAQCAGRLIKACDEIRKNLQGKPENVKERSHDFMRSDHLGWLLTCPSNVGTGLRAGCMVKLEMVSKHEQWKPLLKRLGLQARGVSGIDSEKGHYGSEQTGVWDISNTERIGKDEIQLVNIVIEGIHQLTKWESMLSDDPEEGREERHGKVKDEIQKIVAGEVKPADLPPAPDRSAYHVDAQDIRGTSVSGMTPTSPESESKPALMQQTAESSSPQQFKSEKKPVLTQSQVTLSSTSQHSTTLTSQTSS